MKQFTLSVFSLALTVCFLYLLDRTLIRQLADQHELPRYERQFTATPEFQYTADINSNGYRNDEFKLGHNSASNVIRIVTIGDSFTYGWGVEEADSWPRILGALLEEDGYRVEILNLGKPGDSPHSYARTARRWIPQLKPDLVITGILQGDDIAQLKTSKINDIQQLSEVSGNVERSSRQIASGQRSLRSMALGPVKWIFQNFFRLRAIRERTQIAAISSIWSQQFIGIRDKITQEQQPRYAALPPELIALYQKGEISPYLFQLSIIRPDYFSETWELGREVTEESVAKLAECIRLIEDISIHNGAATYFVSIPYGMYCTTNDWHNWHYLGFDLRPEMTSEDNADAVIHTAAELAGASFHSLTPEFRPIARDAELYYRYDGHFNPRGHREFARLLADKLQPLISEIKQRKAAESAERY